MDTASTPVPAATPDWSPALDSRGTGAVPRVTQNPAFVAAWPRSAQLTTAFLICVALTALVIHAVGYFPWGSKPTDLERGAVPAFRVDLNRADRAELLQLPGVGENLATRIEDHRASRGPYLRVDDLRGVKGVGPVTMDRLRDWVEVDEEKLREERDEGEISDGPPPAAGKKSTSSATVKAGTKKKTPPSKPIDINKANAEELQKLPEIGPAFAQRIIDEREKKPFEKVEDLTRVPGIKERRLESLRPYVTVSRTPSSGSASTDAP